MFKLSYKRKYFWHTHTVEGFKLDPDNGRMSLFLKDGSILEIPDWNKCYCRLGADYFKLVHEKMQRDAGQAIPVKV